MNINSKKIIDIQLLSFNSGGYKMPSAYTFFSSMHSTDKTPARVANGSWNTKYRPYPFSCKFFDDNLHGEFKGDLYVASAGNEGLDEATIQSKARTIGNPASCKNTLAGKYTVFFILSRFLISNKLIPDCIMFS